MANPRVVVFDLDYTLWPVWCDTHVSPPFKVSSDHRKLTDRYGEQVSFYRDVPRILQEIKESEDMMAVSASRTCAPKVADDMLTKLHVTPGKSAMEYLEQRVYGTGSKIAHFTKIHNHTGVPYEDMVFFDDELRNMDVERKLGVTFVEVSNGMTYDVFKRGLELWRKRNYKG